jgi:hypothetical protein
MNPVNINVRKLPKEQRKETALIKDSSENIKMCRERVISGSVLIE